MARRFFAKESDIYENQIVVKGQEHIHISKVLRLSVGEEILISTDKNNEIKAQIEKIGKVQTECKILSKQKIDENISNIAVFQALMKGEHMDYAVQKLTELNTGELVLFDSQFVIAKEKGNKMERLERISIEACKQSGRKMPLNLVGVLSFDEMLKELGLYNQIIVAYENSTVPAKDVVQSLDINKKTAVVVGSEGGFSPKEIEMLKQIGAKDISLGKTILRGETACIALASVLKYSFNEWRRE